MAYSVALDLESYAESLLMIKRMGRHATARSLGHISPLQTRRVCTAVQYINMSSVES